LASVVAGLVVAGIIGVLLEVVEVPLGSVVGAFLGGIVAAWLLYSARGKATAAGFAVGIVAFPLQLSIYIVLLSSGLYSPPIPEPSPTTSEILIALVVTVVLQIFAGSIGGLLGGILHHPPLGAVAPARPHLPPPPPRPEKYCVQCGAGLAEETSVCPACGAKQPQ